jgi:hypothetical protein
MACDEVTKEKKGPRASEVKPAQESAKTHQII